MLVPYQEVANRNVVPIPERRLGRTVGVDHIKRANEAVFGPEMVSSDLRASSVDGLVVAGIQHILATGERVDVNAGSGLQSYGVSYLLEDSRRRVHTLRAPKTNGFQAAEMVCFLNGSLAVEDGLEAASQFWARKADADGRIQSNYGTYVFHQAVTDEQGAVIPGPDGLPMSQYDWVINNLDRNLQSRKAFINLNQPMHKKPDTQDFPCVTGAQFFVRTDAKGNKALCSEVSSRSTDVVTGLPYNVGFFSTLTELVWADLVQRGHGDILLGYTRLKPSFTQLYDRTAKRAQSMLDMWPPDEHVEDTMPPIDNAHAFLTDIYAGTAETPIMNWLYNTSKLNGTAVEPGHVVVRPSV